MQLKDLLHKWSNGEIDPPPVARLLGIRLVEHGEGRGTVEIDAKQRHHNAMGTVHGGILCDLADVAMGVAMATVLGNGETFTTLGLQISYFRPIEQGRLTARGRVVRRGRTVSYCECEVVEANDVLVAKASSTCLTAESRAG